MKVIFFVEVTVTAEMRVVESYITDEVDLDVLPRVGDELRINTAGSGMISTRVEKVTWDVTISPEKSVSIPLTKVWVFLRASASRGHTDRVLRDPAWKYAGGPRREDET